MKTAEQYKEFYDSIINKLEHNYNKLSETDKKLVGGISTLLIADNPIEAEKKLKITSHFVKLGYDVIAMFSISDFETTEPFKTIIKHLENE